MVFITVQNLVEIALVVLTIQKYVHFVLLLLGLLLKALGSLPFLAQSHLLLSKTFVGYGSGIGLCMQKRYKHLKLL